MRVDMSQVLQGLAMKNNSAVSTEKRDKLAGIDCIERIT